MTEGGAKNPKEFQVTCGACRFWAARSRGSGDGECLLASGDMSLGNGQQPKMHAEADESGTRGTSVFDDSPVAVLETSPGFSCIHAELRGDLVAGRPAQQLAWSGYRECRWEESLPGERIYRCPDREVLVWPNCEDCPFRKAIAWRSQVTGDGGRVTWDGEREYLGECLDRALERAREAMDLAARLNGIIGSLEGRKEKQE